jgi:hypothetical protein
MFKLYDKASSHQYKRGRYNSGGKTIVFAKKLGWWERDISFQTRQIDDIYYEITIREVGRSDLISYDVYKRNDLEWLVLQYNNIVDPIEELYIGRIITLPSVKRAIFDITS